MNCSAATVYIVFQEQLLTGGQLISSANPDAPYEPFSVPGGGIGITTTFAIDGNDILTWHNATFVDGQAYFCEQDSKIYALFYDLYYQGYPINCEIVSLVVIPGKKAYSRSRRIKLI